MKRLMFALLALLTLCPVAMPAQGQPTKDQLKGTFKAREADLQDLKRRGQVGETIDGYVGAVDAEAAGDQRTAGLLRDENGDRRVLYQLLADEINRENPQAPVKATIDTIAVRNALRNIERASPDEFLRVAKDHWIRVKDFPRFQELTKLKTQGKVGETPAGLVEIVQDADRSDGALAGLVDEENARRTAEHKARAAEERVGVPVIVERAAKRNLENARIGDMVKDERGAWRRK